jgi:hypothetical protein
VGGGPAEAGRRGRRVARGAAAGGLVLLAALGVVAARFADAVVLTAGLAFPASQAWLDPLAAPIVREPLAYAAARVTVEADLYRPERPRGALLLVHGLSPAGRRHPDLVRVARLLAQRGQAVLVPHFEGLAAFRLTGREVEEVRAGLRALRALHPAVGVAGFSFGAGPALLAAAEEPAVRVAGSFGGYAHLRHVIAFVTTGEHHFEGRRYRLRQEEYNRWKLLALLVGFVEDAGDRERLAAVSRVKLGDPAADTGAAESGLAAEGRAILALVRNRRAEAVEPLAAALPRGARAALDRLSPAGSLIRLRGRLLIVHGVDDPSIPFTESLRLAAEAGGRARVAILGAFHHTGPHLEWSGLGRLPDALRLLLLGDELLASSGGGERSGW